MQNEYFGIDIGDGETAVSYCVQGTNAFPNVLEIQGEANMPTVISMARDGRYLIGSSTRRVNANTDSLHVRFKSKFLADPNERIWLEQFAQALREGIQATGHMADMSRAKVHIGCPSGWGQETQETYLRMMERAGFTSVTIAKESRAAMLYAREASELRLTMDQLHRPFLIIDSGSSTTDFTYVYQKSIIDWGEVALGGGILDELLLTYNLKSGNNEERAAQAIAKNPLLRANAELLAREVKELYFDAKTRGDDLTYPIEKAERYYLDPPVLVTMICTREIMEELVDSPCQQLNGQSYKAFFREHLGSKKKKLPCLPETILLTGGASRMDFIQEIAQKVFPEAKTILGVAPEFAIAHGLCLMQRIQDSCDGFRRDIQAMIDSDAVENVVERNLQELFPQLVSAITDEIFGDIIPRSFHAWKRGDIPTVKEMEETIGNECKLIIQQPKMQEKLHPIIARWLQTLRPEIEEITTPICIKNGIEPTRLLLPNFVDIGTGLPFKPGMLVDLGLLQAIIAIVMMVVGGMISGGAGTALIAAGPAGWVTGALIALVLACAALILGKNATKDYVYSLNLPMAARRLVPEGALMKKLQREKGEIQNRMLGDLRKQLAEKSENSVKMTNEISQVIEKQLLKQMEDSLILLD